MPTTKGSREAVANQKRELWQSTDRYELGLRNSWQKNSGTESFELMLNVDLGQTETRKSLAQGESENMTRQETIHLPRQKV